MKSQQITADTSNTFISMLRRELGSDYDEFTVQEEIKEKKELVVHNGVQLSSHR